MIQEYITKYKKLFIALAGVLAILICFSIYNSLQFKPIDPRLDTVNEDPNAGKDYSLIYNYADFYDLIADDATLRNLQYDLKTYGQTFYSEFKSEDTLMGFTFKDGSKKIDDSTFEFRGQFYGVGGEITLTAKIINENLLRVSIVDENQSSVNEKLRLNGPFSRLAENLPIDEDLYSIRYLASESKVVVTFYTGYQITDLDRVQDKLKELLQDDPANYKIDYYVNARGQYTLSDIRALQPILSLKP